MIGTEAIARQIAARAQASPSKALEIATEYGEARSEILGYIISFREHVTMLALDDLIHFFVFLVELYEQEGYGRLYPTRDIISKEDLAIRKKVKRVLGESGSRVAKSAGQWISGFEEKAILAYATKDVIAKYDVTTEEGVQMYIGVVALIQIFAAEAKKNAQRSERSQN